MFRAYRFRMYPTKEQSIQMNKTFGCTRYVYNHFLEEKKTEYQMTGKSKSAYGMNKELTILRKEYDWLKEIDSCSLQASVFALDDAFKGFYNGKGYPKFKCSSQICNVCDYKNKEVKYLSVRKWECPRCHNMHDRDINASINIMFEGAKLYMRELEQA